MQFVTTVYGEKHASLLFPCIYSILKANNNYKVLVLYQDVQKKIINSIKFRYKGRVKFVEVDFDLSGGKYQVISKKMIFWNEAIDYIEDGNICFIDSDTVMLKPIDKIVETIDADIIFTVKNERIPINTGVVIIKSKNKAKKFLKVWKDATIKIIENPNLLNKSLDKTLPYGGCDQMSLYELINYEREKIDYKLFIDGLSIKLKAYSCRILNHTMRGEDLTKTKILHFKTPWQDRIFTGKKLRSNEIYKYKLYFKYLKLAIDDVNKCDVNMISQDDLGIESVNTIKLFLLKYIPITYYLYNNKIVSKISHLINQRGI